MWYYTFTHCRVAAFYGIYGMEVNLVGVVEIILGVVVILVSIAIICAGISGVISGGADTFLSKNKARTFDAFLARWTKYLAILFFVLAIVANFIALKGK